MYHTFQGTKIPEAPKSVRKSLLFRDAPTKGPYPLSTCMYTCFLTFLHAIEAKDSKPRGLGILVEPDGTPYVVASPLS